MALSFDFDFEVTKATLLYLASKELPEFDKYRAVKLVFLADREHLLRFGRTITGDAYSALPYGPTPDRTLCLLNGLAMVALEGKDPISDEIAELAKVFSMADLAHPTYHAKSHPDWDALSKSDLIVLDHVVDQHGRKSFNELMALTHGMRAYTLAWRNDVDRKKFPMAFEDFFAEEPDKEEFLKEIEEEQHLAKLFSSKIEFPKVMSA